MQVRGEDSVVLCSNIKDAITFIEIAPKDNDVDKFEINKVEYPISNSLKCLYNVGDILNITKDKTQIMRRVKQVKLKSIAKKVGDNLYEFTLKDLQGSTNLSDNYNRVNYIDRLGQYMQLTDDTFRISLYELKEQTVRYHCMEYAEEVGLNPIRTQIGENVLECKGSVIIAELPYKKVQQGGSVDSDLSSKVESIAGELSEHKNQAVVAE